MIVKGIRRMNSTKNDTESWVKNFFKVANFPSTRDKKINTFNKLFQYKKINLKSPKDSPNITPQNSTINSNHSNLIISSKKKPMFHSQINFILNNFSPIKIEREKTEPIKEEIKFIKKPKTNYKRVNLINIINLSKISMLYKSIDKSNGYKTFYIPNSKTTKNVNKKKAFNNLEDYFRKKYNNIQPIKHEYKPNLQTFLINGNLKQFHKKSEKMMHIKNDINNIYKDSAILNNIIDYVSTKLYKIRKDTNKKANQEIKKTHEEKLYKKLMKLKIERGEISQDKLFYRKNYMTDDYNIKKRLKAKLIYKNGYSSNSFKVMLNKIKNQTQIDLEKNDNNWFKRN